MKRLLLFILFITTYMIASASNVVNIRASKDNTLIQSAGGLLANSTGDVFAGRTNQDGTATATTSIRRGLVYFDMSSEELAHATIDSVRLYMYFSKTSGVGTQVTLHKVTTDWTEGTSYYNGGAGTTTLTDKDVTWLAASYNATTPSASSLWTTAGGDFEATSEATTYVGTSSQYGFVSWSSASMKNDVTEWIASPTRNYGWLLKGDESTGQTSKQFSSHENSTEGNRPLLKVYYTKPSTTDIQSLANVSFSTYPNPATDHISVRFAERNQERILIYNLCGGMVKIVEPNNGLQTTIGLSDIKTGIYLMKVGTQTAKLVVK
jgi:hypothetical protein